MHPNHPQANHPRAPWALSPAALLALALVLAGCGKQDTPPEPERAVRTVVLSSSAAGLTHEYAAEIRARVESRLSFRVGGKLLARKVDLGNTVKPGQLLAQLDGQDLVLAQDAAKAGLQAARVNRDQAAADYKRFIELKEQGFISAAELERRDTAFKSAQSQLDQARAQLGAQDNQAGYARLLSDAGGVVTAVYAEAGMVVAAGTPIVQVAHDGPRDVVFSVPEDQLARVRAAAARPGALRVKLWGDDKPAQPVQLREVSAATDPVTRTFLLKADVGTLDARLGQTATVSLVQPGEAAVIKLPLTALVEQQGKTAVWVLNPQTMQVAPQPVQVGGAEGNEVLIAAGLRPGQEVVVAGVHVLTPGQKVRRYQPLASAMQAAAPSASAPSAASAASR